MTKIPVTEKLAQNPDEVNKLIGLKFVAEYTKCAFIPVLKTYRHVLELADDSNVLVQMLGEVLPKYDLNEEATVKVRADGGVDLLICFDADHPFGVHEWQIKACQVYKDPRYLLIWVTRLRPVTISGSESRSLTIYEAFNSAKEFCKMVALMFCVVIDAFVQVAWAFQRTVEVTMIYMPPLINSLMPFFLALVNALTKCVGGLYLLIAMLFGRGMPVPVDHYGIEGSNPPRGRVMPIDYRRSSSYQRPR